VICGSERVGGGLRSLRGSKKSDGVGGDLRSLRESEKFEGVGGGQESLRGSERGQKGSERTKELCKLHVMSSIIIYTLHID
jgi:hypothetical protein